MYYAKFLHNYNTRTINVHYWPQYCMLLALTIVCMAIMCLQCVLPDCMCVIASDQSSQGRIQEEEHKKAKLYVGSWGEKIICPFGVAPFSSLF